MSVTGYRTKVRREDRAIFYFLPAYSLARLGCFEYVEPLSWESNSRSLQATDHSVGSEISTIVRYRDTGKGSRGSLIIRDGVTYPIELKNSLLLPASARLLVLRVGRPH